MILVGVLGMFAMGSVETVAIGAISVLVLAIVIRIGLWLLGFRYIPHDRIGLVEKIWSFSGSLTEGRIIAFNGEAGFQSDILRGGMHFGYFPWQYRIHRVPLVIVGEGQIGYVYARDGQPLPPTQTLGRSVSCNHYQDGRAFLLEGGQRGRQRAILREGVYAINQALFVVITETAAFVGPVRSIDEIAFEQWQAELAGIGGFRPVLIGTGGSTIAAPLSAERHDVDVRLESNDTIGVVTVHDGPVIGSGEIIAPEVHASEQGDHNYFQDPEMFLALGGRRGKQLEIRPKMLIPIGYVGVVVSYYGARGQDLTGQGFRYGEQVNPNERGVWKEALPPGKYALNPYALKVELVPTINFVLRWITGQTEAHQYDKDLSSIELITADGYEPLLPLSLVLHIDYEKAPRVIQRFGDVRRLITQTLDPILTSYFRDVAQSSNMLDLLTKREEIQSHATEELGRRFAQFDINCIAVLIGRPESVVKDSEEDPIDRLFDQLRSRRLAEEQRETFAKQEQAALQRKKLNEAQAIAEKQAELTQTKINVEIASNQGEARLAEARGLAKRDVELAQGQSQAQQLLGKGEASRTAQVGLAEAAVSLQKVRALGDPRLYAVNLVSQQLAQSKQPLVPSRLFVAGDSRSNGGNHGGLGLLHHLIALLLSEKAGTGVTGGGSDDLDKTVAELQKQYAPESK
jgi:uncharacterized membrane protein YqiK